MIPFLRGGILVGVMELFQAVLGIVIGSRLLMILRSTDSLRSQSESTLQFNVQLIDGEWVNVPQSGSKLEALHSNNMTSIYVAMAVYFISLAFMIAFAVVLIWGIRYGSALKIKLWLYPNVGLIILTGVVTLLISIFMSSDVKANIIICAFAVQIGGILIFRAFQCWIVNEALCEMPKGENDIPTIRVEQPDRFKNRSRAAPKRAVEYLAGDSVI